MKEAIARPDARTPRPSADPKDLRRRHAQGGRDLEEQDLRPAEESRVKTKKLGLSFSCTPIHLKKKFTVQNYETSSQWKYFECSCSHFKATSEDVFINQNLFLVFQESPKIPKTLFLLIFEQAVVKLLFEIRQLLSEINQVQWNAVFFC